MSEPVAETVATPEVPITPEPIADATTIAEHEAQLQTPPEASEDGATTERPRHRARSQRAGLEDIQQIATLTKRLREAESALDIKREDGESDRVYRLRLRAEVAELAKQRKTEAATPPPEHVAKPAPVAATPVSPPPAPVIASAFTEQEPKLADFAEKEDPYAAWTRACAAYDRRKEAFDAKQAEAKTANEQASAAQKSAQEARLKTVMDGYNAKAVKFAETTKDFEAVVKKANPEMTPLLFEALVTADNGPQLVYTLAAQPLLHDEVYLLTDGKPVNEQSVASTQRWLTTRAQAVATGSAAPQEPPTPPVPRPLNPVRTGPMQTGTEPLKDGHSLREHEVAFAYKGRRR